MRVGKVVQKAVPLQIRNVGTVRPITAVAVRALVAGEILQVHFREGQDVTQGRPALHDRPAPVPGGARAGGGRARARPGDGDQRRRRRQALRGPGREGLRDAPAVRQREGPARHAGDRPGRPGGGRARAAGSRLLLDPLADRRPHGQRDGAGRQHRQGQRRRRSSRSTRSSPIYVSFAVPERDLAEIRRRQAPGKLPVDAEDARREDARQRRAHLHRQHRGPDDRHDHPEGDVRQRGSRALARRVRQRGADAGDRANAVVAPPGAVQNGQQGTYAYVVKADRRWSRGP